jgi:tissue inhibitor of metalloproteinase
MRPVTLLLMILSALMFCLLQAARAQACSCRAPATTAKAFKRSVAVFRGKVVKISVPSLDRIGVTHTGAQRVKFEIVKQWKGAPTDIAVVVTQLTAEECGFGFEEQKEYLVYVVGESRQVQTGLCTGTKSAADADHEMQELDHLAATPSR